MANRYWVGGAGTWNTTSTTRWSASSGGATGASVPTAADSVFFDQAGTYTVTMTGALTCLDITVSAGTVTFAAGTTPTLAVSGSMSLIAGTVWSSPGNTTFNATTAGKTITTNGTSLAGSALFNGVGGVWTLGSALTTTSSVSITAGTLNTSASNYAVSCLSLTTTSSANAILTLNASTVTVSGSSLTLGAASVLNAGTSQLNCTSTGTMNFTGGGKTFYNVTFSAGSAAFACTINSANTFNNLTFSAPSASGIKTVIFAASQVVNGTLAGSGASEIRRILYRSDVLGTARTFTLANPATLSNCDLRDITAATSAITATSGGGNCGGNTNITFSAAKTVYWNLAGVQNWSATGWCAASGGSPAAVNFPLAQDTAVFNNAGSAGTVTIETAWNIGTLDMSARTSAMTLATSNSPNIHGSWSNGTGATLSGTSTLTFIGRGNTQQILGNGVSFTQSMLAQNIGGTVQLTSAVTMDAARTFTLSNSTLDLQSYTLSVGFFAASLTPAKAIAFGTGNLTVTGTTGSPFNMSGSNLTVSGSRTVNVTNSTATAISVVTSSITEATAPDINILAGTYTLNLGSIPGVRNLNFTGFSGSHTFTSFTTSIYGNLTLSATATYPASSGALQFAATSGFKYIISNGKTLDIALTFNGVGGYWFPGDALTMGSTRVLTHTNGTLDLNGMTLTVGASYTTAAGTKNLTFNGGTLVCPSNGTAFNNAAPTNFTTTAGTGTGTISMTSPLLSKTFAGGGSTYNCTLNQGGQGNLTVSGSNTFNDITSTAVGATSVFFIAGTTNTFSNFNLNGTAGNLITISSTTSATHTLSKASGTVSVDYLSISYSTATGGATWNAGANSTNGGNNTGWIFGAGPVGNTGAFFSIL